MKFHVQEKGFIPMPEHNNFRVGGGIAIFSHHKAGSPFLYQPAGTHSPPKGLPPVAVQPLQALLKTYPVQSIPQTVFMILVRCSRFGTGILL